MKPLTTSALRALTPALLLGTFISATTVPTVSAGPTSCVPVPAGLVGWWSGEGSALDSTGTNNGTLQGGTSFLPGVVGQAFHFSPANGTVIVPDSTSLRLTSQLTIEAWINTRGTGTDYGIVSKVGGSGGNNGYQLILSGNTLAAQFNSPGEGWPSARITSDGIILPGVWYHVAWTYDQSAMKLYCNGVAVATNAIGAKAIAVSSSNLRISGHDNNFGYFDGLIDEASVYSRALSAAEIAAIYNAGSAGKCALAPSILVQPQGLAVDPGFSATFTAAAGGSPPLGYQWQLNHTAIPGATASALTLTNIQASQAGSYLLIVTNAVGSATSSDAVLTVLPPPPCTPPVAGLVSWWPGEGGANDVVSTNNGTLQGGVSFVAGLVGQAFNFDPANGTVIVPDAASFRLTSQLTIEAWIKTRATSTEYGIVSKVGGSGGDNGYQFLLSGNKLIGQFNSSGETWPSVRITSGDVIASGVWYHVAWTYDQSVMKLYCNGVVVATDAIGAKAIAASSSNLRISGHDNNYGYFDGLIDEPAVYHRALSAAEIAAIYNAGSAGKCPVAPVVHTAPLSQTIECASNVTFSVSASGMAPLAYQWYFGANSIPGATNALLTLASVGFAQAGSYSVIVTNAYGYTTGGPVLLTVVDTTPPTITACASNRSFSAGANCTASLPDLTGEVVAWDASGPVTVAQQPPPGTPLGVGAANVTFTVRDSSSNASPCLCTITVADLTPPTILYCLGEWTLGFDANCQALLPDMTGTNFMMATDNCSSVSVTQAPPVLTPMPFGTNTVWLTASDNAGNQTTRAIAVIVPGEPHIALQLAPLTVVASSNTFFSVLVCGIGPLGYHWQHAGTNLPSGTNSILTLSNVKTNDAGDYRVIISNAAGSVTSVVATLTVLRPPVIARQPKSLAAAPGGAASFSVSVQGRTPFAYQWQRGGSPLAGQTKATLALTNVQSEDFGAYKVGITNADGSAFSEVSLLTLAVSPVIASLDFNSQTFMLTVPTELGPTYVVEYKDRLEEGSWTVLTTIAGTGLPIPITDNGLTNTTRFYRVRVR